MTLVNAETGEVVTLLSEKAARKLTDDIKRTADNLSDKLVQAYDGRAWSALGYTSWRDYAADEFDMSQSRAYQLLDMGRVMQALESAGSTIVERPNEAQARELAPLKDDPEKLAKVWKATVEQTEGKPTAKAVKDAVELTLTQRRAIAVTKYPWLDVVAPTQQIVSTAEALEKYRGAELEQRIETSKKWAAAQTRKAAPVAPVVDDSAARRDIEIALDTLVRFNVEAERATRALVDHPGLLDDDLDQWSAAIHSARRHLDDLTPVPATLRRVK